MKILRLALAATALSLGFVSCQKELGPLIDTGAAAVDTTYETTPEAATPRRVLIEEFTGVTCPNCPAGHAAIKRFIDANPDRISAIGYQIFNVPQANPVADKTRHDNRTQKGTDVGTYVFSNVALLPSAAMDRTPNDEGKLLLERNLWAAMTNKRLAEPSPLNLTITSSYDTASRELKVSVRTAYTAEVSTANSLTLALVENSIVDAQESVEQGNPVVYDEYEHKHVFRDFLTAVAGDKMLDAVAVKKAGRVYERRFTYKLDSNWNADNCVLIAFVHNSDGGQKDVLQVAEKPVK